MNHARKKGRTVKTRTKDVVYLFVGMEKVTIHLGTTLLYCRRHIQEGKTLRLRIPCLSQQTRNIHGPKVDARGSARFHPGSRNSQ